MFLKINPEKVYCCYSWRLKEELRKNGFYPIGEDVNRRTNKTFWIYDKTEGFCKVLKDWTKNKK